MYGAYIFDAIFFGNGRTNEQGDSRSRMVVCDCTVFKVDIRGAKKPDQTRGDLPAVEIGTIFGKLMQSEKCLVLPPEVSCIVVNNVVLHQLLIERWTTSTTSCLL